jgi:hypothetical protein
VRQEARAAVEHRWQARGEGALQRRGHVLGALDRRAIVAEAARAGRIVVVGERGAKFKVELVALAGADDAPRRVVVPAYLGRCRWSGLPSVAVDPKHACSRSKTSAMEAIREFDLEDFPMTVAVECRGISIHRFAVTQATVHGD